MSGLSAGHGMSFPLQHNLGDDTAYSMMHVPTQGRAGMGGVRAGSPASEASDQGAPPGMKGPYAPQMPLAAPPWAAYPWAPAAFYPPPAPPQISEQRLAEIVERIVTAMLERDRTVLPPALMRETRAGRPAPALAPDTAHDIRLAANGGEDAVPAPVGASRGLAAGVIIALVFGGIALLIFGVIVLIAVSRLANPLAAVQEAADAAAERGMDRILSRGLGAADGPLRLRSRARAAGGRLLGSRSGPAQWLREALEEVSGQE